MSAPSVPSLWACLVLLFRVSANQLACESVSVDSAAQSGSALVQSASALSSDKLQASVAMKTQTGDQDEDEEDEENEEDEEDEEDDVDEEGKQVVQRLSDNQLDMSHADDHSEGDEEAAARTRRRRRKINSGGRRRRRRRGNKRRRRSPTPAPTPAPTTNKPEPPDQDFWPQHGEDNSRCKKMEGDRFFGPPKKFTQRQCEIKATNRGYMFYSYEASSRRCLLTKECDNPDKGTKLPFKIFKNQQQFPADVMSCPGGAASKTLSMNKDEYQTISMSVRKQVRSLSTTCNAKDCQQADWAGCVLRMAGHDFMDFRPGDGGGSDGCVDFSDVDNKGLLPCLSRGEFGQSLKDTYQPVCKKVSLADFLVIAAEAVMTETRENAGEEIDFSLGFRFGRVTSTSCISAKGRLPNPEEGCSATDQVFNQFMGLEWHHTAALMAVHTLGRAKTENSGYDGWWSDPENSRRFNNNYFVSLLSKSWKPVKAQPEKHQWNRNDVGKEAAGARHEMMLNTDMCLAFDVLGAAAAVAEDKCSCMWLRSSGFTDLLLAQDDLTNSWCGGAAAGFSVELNNCCPNNGRSCDGLERPTGTAIAAVRLFAEDEDAWISSFKEAWVKATTNGFDDLLPLSEGTWPEIMDKQKCHFKLTDGDHGKSQVTQEECEALANKANFTFYSYDGGRRKCIVHRACDDFVHTHHSWKVFTKPEAPPIPVIGEPLLPIPRSVILPAPGVAIQEPISVERPVPQVQPIPMERPVPLIQPTPAIQPPPIGRPGIQIQPREAYASP